MPKTEAESHFDSHCDSNSHCTTDAGATMAAVIISVQLI